MTKKTARKTCLLIPVIGLLLLAGEAFPQEKAGASFSRKMLLESRYLHFPVRRGGAKQRLFLTVGGAKVREMEIELAANHPDFWVCTEVSEWMGKTIVIEQKKPEAPKAGGVEAGALSQAGGPKAGEAGGLLSDIFQSNEKDGAEQRYTEKYRPQFHFTSLRGWLNDPNGLVWYKGEWQLFYQHNPFGTGWGNMTWGHAVSTDLVHWKEMDDAIQPDQLGTIFSGSAVVDEGNTAGFQKGAGSTLIAMYTAAGKTSDWSASKEFGQCIAFSNDGGHHWTKYDKNPVLPHIKGDNRDPKLVWHAPTRQWIVAIYLDANEYALLSSPDLKSWKELQRISMEGASECPDFFEIALDGNPAQKRWVLTGANDRYLVGSFDGKTFTPGQRAVPGEWGANYYAVQSYSGVPAADGRRIQIGWMSGAEMPGMPFNQQMAFPRELTLRTTPDGLRLFGLPAREINSLHAGVHHWENTLVKGNGDENEDPARTLRGELFHIKAVFDTAVSEAAGSGAGINGALGAGTAGDVSGAAAPVGAVRESAKEFGIRVRGFSILYNRETKMLTVRHPHEASPRQVALPLTGSVLSLEILLDRASIEIFAGNGAVPMAFAYIPDEEDRSVRVVAKEGSVMLKSLDVYDLKTAWE